MAGVLPTDPRAQELLHSPLLIDFFLYWSEVIRREQLDGLNQSLGLSWDVKDLMKPAARPDLDIKKLNVPLASVIDPELQKKLRNYILKDRDKQGKPIKELGAMPLADFKKWYEDNTGMKLPEKR